MENVLARNWAWVTLRGVITLLFGVIAIWYPALTLATLVFLFGAYAFVDGILAIVTAVANRDRQPHWVALLVGGLAGVPLGVGTFLMPAITATVLLYLIAAWSVVIGITQIATGVRLRKIMHGEWLLIVAGVLSVALGAFLVARPAIGALAVVVWIGVYAVVTGVVQIALALRVRSWGRDHGGTRSAMAHPA